ncbi:MAG: hypothetical protein V2I57_11740 [Xanthomonadales bacterium]|nr:hypothetical protein [Xanthomonadales bacterium]
MSEVAEAQRRLFDQATRGYECFRLLESWDFKTESGEKFPGVSDEQLAKRQKQIERCETKNVLDAKSSEDQLIFLSEDGYIPAILYYAKNLPPSVSPDLLDESSMLAYERNVDKFLYSAAQAGSPEALFLMARQLSNSSSTGQKLTDDLEQAFYLVQLALSCGYQSGEAARLSNRLLVRLDYEVAEISSSVQSDARKACGAESGKGLER